MTTQSKVIIQRDYLTVRDIIFREVLSSLQILLPKELILETKHDSLDIPTIIVKSCKSKFLWFKTYNIHARIDFTPDVSDNVDKDFILEELLQPPKERWSILETKTGQLVVACYDPQLETTLTNAVATVSQKCKLSTPVIKRKGYDIGHLLIQDFTSSKPSKISH